MTGPIRIGIVTVSDRASRGEYEDLGGPAIQASLREMLSCPWEAVARIIPDEQEQIESTLRALADDEGCCLIVTTGGTGPAVRDVTPEATEAVCERMMPGFGEGFGIVYLEALACGVPVVGSVLDGSRDALLDGRLGVLVDPTDRADLMRGIREALARPKGEVPALLSEFSESRYVERVHAILDAIDAGTHARA